MSRDESSSSPALPHGVRHVIALSRPGGSVGGLAWSADGCFIAAAFNPGPAVAEPSSAVFVWDAQTGESRRLGSSGSVALSLAFHPSGRMLATAGASGMTVWDLDRGEPIHEHPGTQSDAVAFSPSGGLLASGRWDGVVELWNVAGGLVLRREFTAHTEPVIDVALDALGSLLATGSVDNTVRLWDLSTGHLMHTLEGHTESVWSVAFHADGTLATGGADKAIKLWEPRSGRLLKTLEGHTSGIRGLSFSSTVELLASAATDGAVWLWEPATGAPLAVLAGSASLHWTTSLAFHPSLPRLARVRSGGSSHERIEVVELDRTQLRGLSRPASVSYASAKIVLVGDSGVGKTGLGWRLTQGEFAEHASTHGQQFWLLDDLGTTRSDGAQCEAVLWDLAGQPDYRLIHALFLDDADLALVLFDPTRDDEALAGVEYWLRQLGAGKPRAIGDRAPEAILVAARCDRGASRLAPDELERFCKQRGLLGFATTSARTGSGLASLLEDMRDAIDWDTHPATVTTDTFKQIKDYVLGMKERVDGDRVIMSPLELRRRLELDDVAAGFGDDEMLGAVGHLTHHGYVTWLSTSKGDKRILLAPELLNNVASSMVLEARRNPKGLGSLEEHRVLTADYGFPELEALAVQDRDVLLDSAVGRFLARNLCFRQTDPLTSRVYLVFPGLINLRKPAIDDEEEMEDGVAYTATGSVENLYASLVVLLGYTSTFTRTNQWRDHARYVVGDGMVCGFRLDAERAGELDFVLYFGSTVGATIRTLFQSLFESFLARRNLTIRRLAPVTCPGGHRVNRSVVREQLDKGKVATFCPDCGKTVPLPLADAPITLTDEQAADLRDERREVAQRDLFERALFRVNAYSTQMGIKPPTCFVSYAWGDRAQERWVEALANDLVKAGVGVILDRWDNARVGASIPRFVERIEKSDHVLVVGTPRYRRKYDNQEPMGAFVVAAEGDLIGARMLGDERQKSTVLPVLLEGREQDAFPALLHGRLYADLREPEHYFAGVIDTVLSIYQISQQSPFIAELLPDLRSGEV